jgi:signal transduction histidine kinase
VVIGGAMWAFNTRRLESQVYLLMGLSVALSCWSSAIYTTRELAIDGGLFRVLSLINHLGATGFGGGLLGLFAVYPRPVIKPLIAWCLTLSFIPLWLIDSLQFPQDIASAFHLPLLVYVLVAFGLAFVQWRATRKMPAERAVLKWLLLSVMGTTMIFTVMNIIPAAFMATTLGAQAFTLTGFSLGFVMMALGLSRYKLFNLERWWFQYWTWFFAGIAVLLLDWLLLSLLEFGVEPTLGIAIALVGWLYMPVRQKVWHWISPDAEASLQGLLPDIVNVLFTARNKADVHEAWRVILADAFAPLTLDSTAAVLQAHIADYGQTLTVPSLAGEPAWQLSHPAKGSRLFSQQDIELSRMMFELVEKAFNAIQAREEGVMAERDRIKRDLHDDLGARMLSVLHSTSLDQSQLQARQAMTELRSILNALEQSPCSLEEAFDVWQAEFQERVLQAGFSLEWQQLFKGTTQLSARARHNIGRVLRELISNALRYSGGNAIDVQVEFTGSYLQIIVQDNGSRFDPSLASSGLGKKIVQTRIHELGGSVAWQATAQGGCQVSVGLDIP